MNKASESKSMPPMAPVWQERPGWASSWVLGASSKATLPPAFSWRRLCVCVLVPRTTAPTVVPASVSRDDRFLLHAH